jgi:hypothetical protein
MSGISLLGVHFFCGNAIEAVEKSLHGGLVVVPSAPVFGWDRAGSGAAGSPAGSWAEGQRRRAGGKVMMDGCRRRTDNGWRN